jgi:hypothetical protein
MTARRTSVRSHITVKSGSKSSQTTLKRRRGRLITESGNNRAAGPSTEHKQCASILTVDTSKSTLLQAASSSCPSTPSLLPGFSDDFNISSDVDFNVPGNVRPEPQDDADNCADHFVEEHHCLPVHTKRLRVRHLYLIEYIVYN